MTPSSSLLGSTLMAFAEARHTALGEARRALGVGEMDVRALVFIAANPGTRPTHLREHLGITSAGVSTLVDRLVQRGALRRDVDEVDRRVNHLTVMIDLQAEPWSLLTRFDRDVDAAIAAYDGARAEELATLLRSVVPGLSA